MRCRELGEVARDAHEGVVLRAVPQRVLLLIVAEDDELVGFELTEAELVGPQWLIGDVGEVHEGRVVVLDDAGACVQVA